MPFYLWNENLRIFKVFVIFEIDTLFELINAPIRFTINLISTELNFQRRFELIRDISHLLLFTLMFMHLSGALFLIVTTHDDYDHENIK